MIFKAMVQINACRLSNSLSSRIGRLLLLVLTLSVANIVSCQADDLLPHLKKGYEDCVYRSLRQPGVRAKSNDFELAFKTCQSEEQAIIDHLGALGMASSTIDKALRAFRLRLQKNVR